MTSVIRRMHIHSLNPDYHDSQASRGESIAKKLAGILPKRAVSTALFSTLGWNHNNERNNQSPAECAKRSRQEWPAVGKAAPVESTAGRTHTSAPIASSRASGQASRPCGEASRGPVLRSSANSLPEACSDLPGLLSDITPLLERYSLRQPSQLPPPPPHPRSSGLLATGGVAEPTVDSEHRRRHQHRRRRSNSNSSSSSSKRRSPACRRGWSASTSMASTEVELPGTSTTASLASSRPAHRQEYCTNNSYHQPVFKRYSHHHSEQTVDIEVPWWREDDILIRCARKASRLPGPLSRGSQPTGLEDTRDAAYRARHAKLESEEIKRERISHQRMAEEELRSRLHQRELDSWEKRQSVRVDPLSVLNPEKLMPTQLTPPINKIRRFHVTDHVPVIAFGCPVPIPDPKIFRTK